MKFAIKDFFSKCDQIRRKLWIWSHLLEKFLMKNFIFCATFKMEDSNVQTKKVFSTNACSKPALGNWRLCIFVAVCKLLFSQ